MEPMSVAPTCQLWTGTNRGIGPALVDVIAGAGDAKLL
jgi:hypothetical protein